MSHRDFIFRWIEELARVIRRLLHGAGAVNLDQATAMIEDAVGQMLGPLTALVRQLDPESTADLLHDPDRLFGYAQLLALQSTIEQAKGETGASVTRARAAALARAALRRADDPPEEWAAWVTALEEEGRSPREIVGTATPPEESP